MYQKSVHNCNIEAEIQTMILFSEHNPNIKKNKTKTKTNKQKGEQ
jgi:hypothetical protein